MACIIFGVIHHTIKGVQSGIQAHKDFKSPVHSIDSTTPVDPNTRVPLDRYGHAKEHHPVYGWVMKVEHKFNKGKGRDLGGSGPSNEGARKEMNKEVYEDQSYDPPVGAPPAAPPTYEAAMSGPTGPVTSRHEQYIGSADDYYNQNNKQSDTLKRSNVDDALPAKQPKGFSPSSRSSDSSDSSDTASKTDQPISGNDSTRQIRMRERRIRKAERKVSRARSKAERNTEKGRERQFDLTRIKRAEERLANAQESLRSSRA